ncbi:MAG: group III truncated hemoglobin [Sphingobacteriaceae bacterium]
MEIKQDIRNLEDIKLLVDTFYDRVRENTLLAPIFNERIQDHWPQHLAKMYTFWQTVLLGDHTYLGSPFPPHAQLPITHEHFEQWLDLFSQTIDQLFDGEKAEEAKWRANKMAEMFQFKLRYHRENPLKNIL